MTGPVPRRVVISPLGATAAAAWVASSAERGAVARVILLRAEGGSVAEIGGWIRELRGSGAQVIVHARCAGAAEHAGVLGVHLPASEHAGAWRARVPGILGQSVHSLEEARAAAAGGVDYVMLSPVFSPISKPGDLRPTLGLSGLSEICARVPVPVLALGGVREANAAACLAAGAWGVAGMA